MFTVPDTLAQYKMYFHLSEKIGNRIRYKGTSRYRMWSVTSKSPTPFNIIRKRGTELNKSPCIIPILLCADTHITDVHFK